MVVSPWLGAADSWEQEGSTTPLAELKSWASGHPTWITWPVPSDFYLKLYFPMKFANFDPAGNFGKKSPLLQIAVKLNTCYPALPDPWLQVGNFSHCGRGINTVYHWFVFYMHRGYSIWSNYSLSRIKSVNFLLLLNLIVNSWKFMVCSLKQFASHFWHLHPSALIYVLLQSPPSFEQIFAYAIAIWYNW